MRNLTLAAVLLMGGTSLVAQTAQPTSMTPAGTTAPQASSATGTSDGMAGEAATSATAPTPGSAATATIAAPTADWSADADKDGMLTPLEFAMHVDASNTALTAEAKRERFSRASGNGAIKLLNATADDFSKADRNRDRKVDATELAAWSGGASMTSGAGTMTPLPSAAPDTATPPDTGATMTPSEASNAPDGQQADDTMATDIPPND